MKDDHTAVTSSTQSMQIVDPEIRKSPTKEADEVNQQKNIADNFSESPNLEDLVNSASRSESPLVVSPKNNADVGREICSDGKFKRLRFVSLTILSNREECTESRYSQQIEIALFREA